MPMTQLVGTAGGGRAASVVHSECTSSVACRHASAAANARTGYRTGNRAFSQSNSVTKKPDEIQA